MYAAQTGYATTKKRCNISENFELYEDKEFTLGEQDIEGKYRNLVSKNLENGSRARNGLSEYISQDGLLVSELLSSLKEVRFTEKEFSASIPILDIKYPHSGSQKKNSFHLFNNQLNYILTTYFAESEPTKGNVDRFLSNLLIAPLTEKLSYQNTDKWKKKLSNILWGILNDKWFNHKFNF